MGELFGIIIIIGLLLIQYKYFVINAKLPSDKIEEYLNLKNLDYVRHQKVKKRWNPNFESGESIFISFAYRKHYYKIDALDLEGNPVEIQARWYQSMSFFYKNRAVFKKIS